MEPVDLIPRGYRLLPMAEELVVDYLAHWVTSTPLPGCTIAFTDSTALNRGIFSTAIGMRAISL